MTKPVPAQREWDERTSARELPLTQSGSVFETFFERSADAIWLFELPDPQTLVLVDCNQAAVELIGAENKQQLLRVRPEDLSPPIQPDGSSSAQRSAEIIAIVQKQKAHRFEWVMRRFCGREVPIEVSATAVVIGGKNMHVVISRDISERKRAEADLRNSEEKFRELFEASTDAISILDPQTRMIIACNEATVRMARGGSKEWCLSQPIDSFAPERQPDGRLSREIAQAWIERAVSHGPQRFDWVARRFSGEEFPVEVLLTLLHLGSRTLLVSVSRDISERKKVERELLELNQSLERRVAERTAELTASEARFRAMVEHAPEAIVVLDGDTGHFLFGNGHACGLYGVAAERLAELTPADVSPKFQACGRLSRELAREKMDEALAGGMPVFEWIHRHPTGRLIPTEIRLLRLPAEGHNLIRASIIDNTERKRSECALRESEEKFRALFEGSSQGVVLHDENELLEVNPAAVRIMGCQFPHELLGKSPRALAPPLQPNGESSDAMSRKYIKECLTLGCARFEWLARAPGGRDIPLDVTLTRIEWSGRQVIQASITDIAVRKQTESALREANHELHREIDQRVRAEELLNERVRMSMLNAEVAVALNSSTEVRAMLQQCAELVVRHLDVAFARIWTLDEATETLELQASAGCYTRLDGSHSRIKVGQFKIGSIARQKKPHLTNSVQTDPQVSDKDWAAREGMVAFAGYPLLLENRVLGVLGMFAQHPLGEDVLNALGLVADSLALGIERKRAQMALAESEARFSVAFQASPVFISIMRMSDEKYVLANDALLNWLGFSRDEVLARTSAELGMWDSLADRASVWQELRTIGSVRQRECRWRNRKDDRFTILLSVERITLDNEPHVLSLALDITQRKQAEAEMLKTLAREKELSQLKSNFVSMVSHEFRTPLGIIQSSAELLRDFIQKMDSKERGEQLGSIVRNTTRMAGMMEEILVLSRLDAGKLEFQPSQLDLSTFFNRIVHEVLSATNRRTGIGLRLPLSLARADADERLLGHIFTNLLSNAVKYSEPENPITLSVERQGAAALCVVRDEGIGIPENDRQMLFTAFHRGTNVGNRSGTGLGLLLVKRCVDLHHGKIHIASQLGGGTTVTVTLPVFKMES